MTSPLPVSVLGARDTLISSPCFLLLQTNRPQSRACASVVKTARSWEARTWQELELGALPSPGCSGGSWGLHACGFLLSGMLRAQRLIGSRWQAWQMLLSWWLAVVWAGQDWYPEDEPEVAGLHMAYQKVMGQR